jgi:hypothetical protein
MLGYVVEMYPELPDDAYVHATQVNFESIHAHDVTAERGSLIGQLRREMDRQAPGQSVGIDVWIDQVLRGPNADGARQPH